MDANVRSEGDGLVLAVRGAIDVATLGRFDQCLEEAEARTPAGQELLLDLRGVTFISAAAIGRLGTSGRRLRARGAGLRLQPSPPVARILELLRASGRLPTGLAGDS